MLPGVGPVSWPYARDCSPVRADQRRRAGRGVPAVHADAYRDFDAEIRFAVTDVTATESPLCKSGEVLKGTLKPNQCPAFGKECTPRTPLGATMVSSEGACAAYYHFGRFS